MIGTVPQALVRLKSGDGASVPRKAAMRPLQRSGRRGWSDLGGAGTGLAGRWDSPLLNPFRSALDLHKHPRLHS
jgi:hypothetical protein